MFSLAVIARSTRGITTSLDRSTMSASSTVPVGITGWQNRADSKTQEPMGKISAVILTRLTVRSTWEIKRRQTPSESKIDKNVRSSYHSSSSPPPLPHQYVTGVASQGEFSHKGRARF